MGGEKPRARQPEPQYTPAPVQPQPKTAVAAPTEGKKEDLKRVGRGGFFGSAAKTLETLDSALGTDGSNRGRFLRGG